MSMCRTPHGVHITSNTLTKKIPKIKDMLLNLEGFTYASSLDLNMGYYHIEWTREAKQLCTIVLPWGKYDIYVWGLQQSQYFQEKRSETFERLDMFRAYIDDTRLKNKGKPVLYRI